MFEYSLSEKEREKRKENENRTTMDRLPERMMAWGYPVSDCCLTASWTTLFSWGAKGTALVLVKVNGFPTSVYGLIQTSMGPTFVWNAFRLSYPFRFRGGGPPHLCGRREMRLLFLIASSSCRPRFLHRYHAYQPRGLWMPRCFATGRINRDLSFRDQLFIRLSLSFIYLFDPIENFTF